eukprot:2099986-Prymnesium_polylepis.1
MGMDVDMQSFACAITVCACACNTRPFPRSRPPMARAAPRTRQSRSTFAWSAPANTDKATAKRVHCGAHRSRKQKCVRTAPCDGELERAGSRADWRAMPTL